MNQAVPRTTPSRRRVTWHGLVHNEWGVRRHCGRLAGECSFPKERRCKSARQRSRQEKGKATTRKNHQNTRETPENQPEPRTEKQPLGRRTGKTPNIKCRVSGAKKKREITRKNSGRSGLDGELEAEMWVEPRERVDRPLGLTKIPGPPGTAGISVSPAPEKVNKE